MNISATQNIQMAVSTVWNHKFRSLLTVLGIVIGITTVVTVASLLTGLRIGVVTNFQSLGPDNIFVSKVSGDPSGGAPPKEQKRRATSSAADTSLPRREVGSGGGFLSGIAATLNIVESY